MQSSAERSPTGVERAYACARCTSVTPSSVVALTLDADNGNVGVGWTTECPRRSPTKLLAVGVRGQVLFRSLRCIVDGVHLVVGRHVRLIHRRQNVFHLVKLGCFAVVPCCVLMVFGRTLMEFAQR